MLKVYGICNLHDSPRLGQLTENRPLGPTTFLGRYGLMDFTLSNFSNSGINRVAVLVEKGQQVKQSDVIAKLGMSGRATGPHVHFYLMYDNYILQDSYDLIK